jgi:hypothetical protein
MKSLLITFIILALSFSYSYSQGLFESVTQGNTGNKPEGLSINGYVRGLSFIAAEKYDYPSVFGETALQTKINSQNLILYCDLRFRSGYFYNEQINEFEIKEAYAGITSGIFDIIIGNQIITWGRTDGFNPTNNISPNNYFFLSANPDDQKLSNFMLSTEFRVSPAISISLIGIPVFKPSIYKYNLLDINDNASFANPLLPDKSLKNGSLAAKLDFEFPAVGFSLSWFNGYDPFYGFDIKNIDFSTGAPVITYIPSFYRKTTLGFDFSLPIGTWIIRSEGAYNLPENNENKMYIPNKDISYVVGLEHDFKGFLTIFQYIGKYTLEYKSLDTPQLTDPSNPLALLQYATSTINYESALFNRKIFHQQEEMNHAVSVIISKSLNYETLNIEITGYYDITSKEYLIRPSLKWNISNSLSATAGYSYMNGPAQSLFFYAAPVLSGGFIEIKASF